MPILVQKRSIYIRNCLKITSLVKMTILRPKNENNSLRVKLTICAKKWILDNEIINFSSYIVFWMRNWKKHRKVFRPKILETINIFLTWKKLISYVLHIMYYESAFQNVPCGNRSTQRLLAILRLQYPAKSLKSLKIFLEILSWRLSWRYLSKIADLIWISKTFMVPLNVSRLSTCITKLFVFGEILLDLSFSNSRISKINPVTNFDPLLVTQICHQNIKGWPTTGDTLQNRQQIIELISFCPQNYSLIHGICDSFEFSILFCPP